MLKVLIVEDEKMMREGLQILIPWKEHHIDLSECAANGVEALRILEGCPVDIMITDLNMPVMGGLELIKHVCASYPHIRIAVLSAYDDFHMVSEAFKLGAKEYILKLEMEPQKVIQMIKNFEEEIREERDLQQKELEQKQWEEVNKKKLESLENQMLKNKEIIKENFLKKLIWNPVGLNNGWQSEAKAMGLGLVEGKYKLMVVKVLNYEMIEKDEWLDYRETLKFSFLNVMQEVLDSNKSGNIFCNVPGEFVVIFSYPVQKSEYDIEIDIIKIFNNFSRFLSKYLQAQITAGISDYSYSIINLKEMYNYSCLASELWFIKGKGKLFAASDTLNCSGKNLQTYIYDCTLYFQQFLNEENTQELYSMVTELKESFLTVHEIQSIKEMFKHFNHYIMQYINSKRMTEKFMPFLNQYDELLSQVGEYHELITWLLDFIREFEKELVGSRQIINKVKFYIQQNYNQELTLQELAEEFEVSPFHLSRLFTKTEGVSFMDYLTNVRIENAIRLMNSGNMKIYEIALRVGYANVEHFSRTFKKKTGKSPKQFAN